MKNLFFVLGLLCLQSNLFSQSHSKPLDDGFYLVAKKISDTVTMKQPNDGSLAFVRFNPLFIENAPDNTQALLVYAINFVPLELAKEPQLVDGGKQKKLELSLSKLAADKLAAFTTDNLMKEATLIVDGQALTVNKIRAAITGGKLEITRCSDNACEKIQVQLKNNVSK